MRKASLADVPQLVTMMAQFYSDSPYTLNPRRAGFVAADHMHLTLGLAEPAHAP